jgi:hypothetical protein
MVKIGNQIIYLTFDIDWVSDKIISHTISILEDYGLNATFFATHDSQLLKTLSLKKYEIGLHPNFDLGNGQYDINALEKLKEIYPSAVGTRSHSLFFSSRVLQSMQVCGLQYESNIFLWRHEELHLTKRTKTIDSIPFNWSDDKHVELECPFSMDTFPQLNQSGLNIFNFHPVHIYLNTDVYSRYETAKHYFNIPEMDNYINIELAGVGTLFKLLCNTISKNDLQTGLLKSLIGKN